MTDTIHHLAKSVTADNSVISKALSAIKSAGHKFQVSVDLCAACCLVHAIVHGNVTPARTLLGNVPNGMRVNALRTWFEAMGPFVWNKESKELDFDKSRAKVFKAEYAKNKVAFASRLMTEPAHVFSKEKEYQGFSLKAALAIALAKAEKAEKQTGDKAEKNDLTGIAQFRKFMASIS